MDMALRTVTQFARAFPPAFLAQVSGAQPRPQDVLRQEGDISVIIVLLLTVGIPGTGLIYAFLLLSLGHDNWQDWDQRPEGCYQLGRSIPHLPHDQRV